MGFRAIFGGLRGLRGFRGLGGVGLRGLGFRGPESLNTKNPPVVQLRATKPEIAYEGELAVAFKLRKSKRAAPERASARDIPRDQLMSNIRIIF